MDQHEGSVSKASERGWLLSSVARGSKRQLIFQRRADDSVASMRHGVVAKSQRGLRSMKTLCRSVFVDQVAKLLFGQDFYAQ